MYGFRVLNGCGENVDILLNAYSRNQMQYSDSTFTGGDKVYSWRSDGETGMIEFYAVKIKNEDVFIPKQDTLCKDCNNFCDKIIAWNLQADVESGWLAKKTQCCLCDPLNGNRKPIRKPSNCDTCNIRLSHR